MASRVEFLLVLLGYESAIALVMMLALLAVMILLCKSDEICFANRYDMIAK